VRENREKEGRERIRGGEREKERPVIMVLVPSKVPKK
jgi:hypothetical protein